ncbi:MAG: patatin family protein [Clostridia bacterium]|nr:patatin family protein [Clostridia bacterium]
MERIKTGIIDVGGGMRGIYAAGVLDRCIDDGVLPDVCIGVSAGSGNLARFLARQPRCSYKYYTEYSFRKEYISVRNLLTTGNYVDLDYAYGTLTNSTGEMPLDYETLRTTPAELVVVATEAETGAARYFTKADIRQDDYDIMKASSTLPGVNKPYVIGGVPYFDGALSDPVPLGKALEMGCEKLVLLLTKPLDVQRTDTKDKAVAKLIRRRWPVAAENLCRRAERYNAAVETAKAMAAEGKALIIAPVDTFGADTLSRKKEPLEKLYRAGYEDGAAVAPFLSGNAPANG